MKGIKYFIAVFVLLLPTLAFGLSLDEAKRNGDVGETPAGYLAPVKGNPTGEVSELVRRINSEREKHYQKISAQYGTPVKEVARLAGAKAIQSAEKGTFVKRNGGWQQK